MHCCDVMLITKVCSVTWQQKWWTFMEKCCFFKILGSDFCFWTLLKLFCNLSQKLKSNISDSRSIMIYWVCLLYHSEKIVPNITCQHIYGLNLLKYVHEKSSKQILLQYSKKLHKLLMYQFGIRALYAFLPLIWETNDGLHAQLYSKQILMTKNSAYLIYLI